jgi:hypothetical protein
MIEWLKQRSFPTRVLVYSAAAILAFAVAAGVGAITALMIQGGNSQLRGGDAEQAQQEKTAAQHSEAGKQSTTPLPQEAGVEQKDDAPQQDEEARYVKKVGELQADAVEVFLASHDKLSRYDALTADDVEEMKSQQATLQDITNQVANLEPPQGYGEQYKVFGSAISELYDAARLAHSLAADPVSASQSGFDEYDLHVNDAAARLQRSNDILDRDFETLHDTQDVSPS